jgi:hypothetical protein
MLQQIIDTPDCDHFVWLSKRIMDSEPVHMVWVYGHELRHVVQDTLYPRLSEMTSSLRKAQQSANLQPSTQVELPQELDAELAAKGLVLMIFGEDTYRAYRRGRCENAPKATDYFRRFDELASDWRGDPLAETKRLLAVFDMGRA